MFDYLMKYHFLRFCIFKKKLNFTMILSIVSIFVTESEILVFLKVKLI
jgi:hypothetical protein